MNLNLRQKIFIFSFLSKLAMLGTLYFGFWAFIYDFAWWNKPVILVLMTNGVNIIICFVCFVGWLFFDMWQSHAAILMPSFKLERGEGKGQRMKPKKQLVVKDGKLVATTVGDEVGEAAAEEEEESLEL